METNIRWTQFQCLTAHLTDNTQTTIKKEKRLCGVSFFLYICLMENFLFFLHILAWPIAIIGTILGVLTFYLAIKYPGSIEESIDALKGQRTVYKPFRLLVPAFIAWAFIIAF